MFFLLNKTDLQQNNQNLIGEIQQLKSTNLPDDRKERDKNRECFLIENHDIVSKNQIARFLSNLVSFLFCGIKKYLRHN